MSQQAKFRITTAWASEDGENPWLVCAYDEYTEDAHDGTPGFFDEAVKQVGGDVRIVDLYVDYAVIEERFASVDVVAHANPPGVDQ